MIPEAWVRPEWPTQDIGEQAWIEMFRGAGFVFCVSSDAQFDDGGRSLHRPTEPLTVYRGAPLETAGLGMSWSLDEARARWFAKRWLFFGRPSGLYRGVVPPEGVFAMFNDRTEQEVVLDPLLVESLMLIEITPPLPTKIHPILGEVASFE